MPIRRWAAGALLALLPSWALASGVLEYVGSTPTGCASAPPLPAGTFAGRAVSPEGDLYEIRSEGTARWRRNPATGALTVEIQGLSDPRLVATRPDPYYDSLRQAAFTSDGHHVVLGLPGEQSGNARVLVVERDGATGVLTAVAQEIADTGVKGPDALVVAPDGRHVYLAGYAGGRRIQAFERNLTTGMLTALGSTAPPQSNGGVYRGLVASGDGLHLYGLVVTPGFPPNCSDPGILLEAWGRNPVTGTLSLLQAYTVSALSSCGADPREWNEPVISSDGADVYVMSPYGLVHQFRRAPATGLLTRAGAAGLPGPYYPDLYSYNWRLVIRPDGGFLYVESGEVLARDPATGALTYAGTIPDFDTPIGFAGDGDLITAGPRVYRLAGPTGFGPVTDDDSPTSTAGAMALSPDGAHMYVHCVAEDAVAWLAVDQDLGVVTPAGKFVDGGGGPYPYSSFSPPLVVSPDGRHVYAGSLHGDGIATLARDAATGALTFAGAVRQGEAGIDGLRRLNHLALTADATSLYAAAYAPDVYPYDSFGYDSPRLSVFARDAGSGALTQLQVLAEWTFVYWRGASLAIPEDGAQVYFYGGSRSDAPPPSSVLRRDPATGRLDPGQALKLDGWPTFGPGGIHYYVAGYTPVVRRRDPVTGALSAVQSLPKACWTGPLTVGGGGDYAHVRACLQSYIGTPRRGITTLRRDPVSGMLTEVQQLDEGPVLGAELSTSRDGRHVWGVADNGIAHYRRREPCAPAPLAGCRVPTRPGAASLELSDGTGTRDQLKLRWTRGGAVTRTELGEPDVSTEYAACVYDAAGPQPVTSLLVPAGGTCRDEPCWQWRAQGFTYRNRERTPDGVALVSVKPGGDGETSLRLQANKGAVPPLGLPLDAPVVVQIQASNGTCWEARFSDLRVNDGGTLVARSD